MNRIQSNMNEPDMHGNVHIRCDSDYELAQILDMMTPQFQTNEVHRDRMARGTYLYGGVSYNIDIIVADAQLGAGLPATLTVSPSHMYKYSQGTMGNIGQEIAKVVQQYEQVNLRVA